jgi:hypothetical protein
MSAQVSYPDGPCGLAGLIIRRSWVRVPAAPPNWSLHEHQALRSYRRVPRPAGCGRRADAARPGDLDLGNQRLDEGFALGVGARADDLVDVVGDLAQRGGWRHRRFCRQARYLLRHAGIDEPVTWEPPFDWVTGVSWPGPHPDDINPADLHPLIQAGLPVRAAAARLGTSIEHVRLTAARHPAPKATASTMTQAPGEPDPPGTGQLRELTRQGFGSRKIARITGCSERVIQQLLVGTGLRQPAPRPHRDIDPQWLNEQYQVRQRSLKDITAETGIPVGALAAAARNAGIPVRQGVNGSAHPLASLGGPGAFPLAIWAAFAKAGSEQRIRRILALPGSPASFMLPARSASSAPPSTARSASSKTPPAPRCCAPARTG